MTKLSNTFITSFAEAYTFVCQDNNIHDDLVGLFRFVYSNPWIYEKEITDFNIWLRTGVTIDAFKSACSTDKFFEMFSQSK